MKTKIVKDIPIGILMIVVSMFSCYGVMVLASNPPTLNLIAIFVLCYVTNKLISVGMDLIQGIKIADKNDKK